MSEKPISDLRRRMLEDMAVRKFGDKTRYDYIRHVETFTAFLGRSPDTATADDVLPPPRKPVETRRSPHPAFSTYFRRTGTPRTASIARRAALPLRGALRQQ
jgi:hypothetical protein